MSFNDNNLSCERSSKVTKHLKDVSLSYEQDDDKQIPNSWEELYEAESKHSTYDVVNVDKERYSTIDAIEETDKKGQSNAKEDYYTSLQRTVSAELKAAHNFDLSGKQKSVKKCKPRWNRKHQSEIDRDKSLLCLWFKEGIMSNAYAPRCPKSPDSDDVTSDDYQAPDVKPITLGDYMPSMCKSETYCDERDIFERRDSKVNLRAVPISENKFDDWDEIDAREVRLIKQRADFLDEQQRLYCERNGLSAPIWVKPKSDIDSANGESAESDYCEKSAHGPMDHASITKVGKDFITKTSDDRKSGCYSSLDEVMNEYLNQFKKRAESRIPLCKHGVRYLAERFAETLVSEGKVLVEFLPRNQLFAFANALRDLVKEIESLQLSLLNNKFLICQKAYCRWKHLGKYKNQGMRHPKSPLTHHNDLASLKTKVLRVDGLEFKLQTILDCEYNSNDLERYSEEALKIRYKKDLDILESNKSRDFSTNIKRFVETVFREVFVLMESLPQEDALNLRKSIDEFIKITHSMQAREKRIQNRKEVRCCNFFRLKRSERENSSSNSDISLPAETDYTKRSDLTANPVSDITDYTKQSVFSDDYTSSQTDNIGVCDQFTQTGLDQCQTTVKRRTVHPRRRRPSVLDLSNRSPRQLSPVSARPMAIIQEAIPDGTPKNDQETIIEPIVSIEEAVRAAFDILTSVNHVEIGESELETVVRRAIDKSLDKQYALQITSASLNAHINQENAISGNVTLKKCETETLTPYPSETAPCKSAVFTKNDTLSKDLTIKTTVNNDKGTLRCQSPLQNELTFDENYQHTQTTIKPVVSVKAAVQAAVDILTSGPINIDVETFREYCKIKDLAIEDPAIQDEVEIALSEILDKEYALEITNAYSKLVEELVANSKSVEYKKHETEITIHELPEGATSKSNASVETCTSPTNLTNKNNVKIDKVDTPRRLTILPDDLTPGGENETSSFLILPDDEMKCSINVRKRNATFISDPESLDDIGIPSSSSINGSDSDSNCELRKTTSERPENYDYVSQKENGTEIVTQDLQKDLLKTTDEVNVVFEQITALNKINEAESEAI